MKARIKVLAGIAARIKTSLNDLADQPARSRGHSSPIVSGGIVMKKRIMLLFGGATLCAFAGLAAGTPTVGIAFNNILSTGTINRDIRTHAEVPLPSATEGSGDDEGGWEAQLQSEGPSNFITQDVAFVPGGYTGWHNHPGILLLTLTEGSVDWYDATCKKHVYVAGDSWTESTSLHYVRATGSVNARFLITYLVAKGHPKRTDQPAPACAAALGLQ